MKKRFYRNYPDVWLPGLPGWWRRGESFLYFAPRVHFFSFVSRRKILRSQGIFDYMIYGYVCLKCPRTLLRKVPKYDFLNCVRLHIFIPHQIEKAPTRGAFLFGGGEGSRTPVRKSLDTAFSECSPSFAIPLIGRRRTAFRLG